MRILLILACAPLGGTLAADDDSDPGDAATVDLTAGGPADVLAPAGDEEAEPEDTGTPPATDTADTGEWRVPPPRTLDIQALGALAHDESQLQLAGELGVAWVRPHPGPFSWEWFEPAPGLWDWDLTDTWVRLGQQADVQLVGTLWPYAAWDQATCRPATCEVSPVDEFAPGPGGRSSSSLPVSRCAPCDMMAWTTAAAALVERYDGDSIDDAPGLTQPVTTWRSRATTTPPMCSSTPWTLAPRRCS